MTRSNRRRPASSANSISAAPAWRAAIATSPELTAERFVPDPFGTAGTRLYRTGDRARYRPDGQIVFAGRGDDQVKIRGQRVELAEIESAVRSLEGVSASAVVIKTGPDGADRLAAYIAGDFVDVKAWRERLRDQLPDGWIPTAFTILEQIPLTATGKVDRRRLPDPVWSEFAEHADPEGEFEIAVANAFADALSLDATAVGAHADFFALGGHSLLAVAVVSRLRDALGLEVPIRTLFEEPEVRGLAARLRGEQAETGHDRPSPPPVQRASDEERKRLSYAQRRLWFLDRLDPGSPAYNLPTSIVLRGALDVSSLERALDELRRRHETLRSRFVEGPNGPEQVIDPVSPGAPSPFPLRILDLSSLSEDERAEESARLCREDARQPFDLERGPLVRALLLRQTDALHTLLVTVHHICADGWSLVVMVRELGQLYESFVAGRPSPLPELDVQYADWAAWQRAWLESGEMDRQLAFWREELQGSETLALPGDRPRPAKPSYRGDAFDIRIEAPLRRRLEAFARQERVTLHMLLLAGYGWTLSRWSGQNQFTVGTPVANRRTAEAEPLIGFFVNTLALRLRIDPLRQTFRQFVAEVARSAVQAQSNQDVPFDRVVEAVQPDRYLGGTPIFQVLFALQNVPVDDLNIAGLELDFEEPGTGVTRFDIELFLAETEAIERARRDTRRAGGLEGLLNYSAELFDRSTMERFFDSFCHTLDFAVAEPDRPLAEFSPLPPEQRRQVLREWNAPTIDYADPLLVHTLFEAQAAAHPEAIALHFGAESMTYGELNVRANHLARELRARGLGAKKLVAVCLDRSFDVVVALLACGKAGAAYVPVDPEYPPDRIALILEDTKARLVLTHSVQEKRLPLSDSVAICLDQEWSTISQRPAHDLDLVFSPDALIYTVYTSGSTGRPKGVAMSHRAISNLLSWQRRDSLASDNARKRAPRTLQFASLSFDVSFQEIFSTLTGGGEIVLITEDQRRDAGALLRILEDTRVERLFLPFVALQQIAETARIEDVAPNSLREVDTAGEQLRITPAIARFFDRLPGCRLVNHYGPSETHLVTVHDLRTEDGSRAADWPELPYIGQPIANAPVYLVDETGQLVPIGTPGEVWVGGAGLARGYLERPDLTAERFVPDPFSEVPGARVYRTGDLARLRANGRLEFLGRRDLQLKIRGYRVEPGEIESVLTRHQAVRQAAVRAHDHGGGKRLVAYVVVAPESTPTPEELRRHLAGALPEHMVPSAIVLMDALPVSPNGKIDRQALPAPDWGQTSTLAPRTKEEESICAIMAEVLELATIGVTDDFFEQGGHSLLATQVISRIRRAFEVEIPLRTLFETPTAEALAVAVGAARAKPAGTAPEVGATTEVAAETASISTTEPTANPPGVDTLEPADAPEVEGPALPPVRRASPEERCRLSAAQERMWFLHRLNSESAVYNLPVAMSLRGQLDLEALNYALEEIERRHEVLRSRIVEGPHGPEPVVDPPRTWRLDPRTISSAGLEEVLVREGSRTFDLARGPLFDARLFRIDHDPNHHVLGLVMHHIVSDGWSLGVLWHELGAFYAAATEGTPAPPELAVQYADWAAWQRRWLEGGALQRQLAHWRTTLEDAPPALEITPDRARPPTATWNGAVLDLLFPRDLTPRLRAFAHRQGATLHMVLLAAYAWTLMRFSGQDDIVIGTPLANRRTVEAEQLIGFFVNTLPVRIRLTTPWPSFQELVALVRDACLATYAHQDVPFERIVLELQPDRSLNRAPIFQTAFALQDVRLSPLELPGLELTPVEMPTDTAKFDFMLLLSDEPDGLSGGIEYNTDLFDGETLKRIATSLQSVLDWAVDRPERPLAAAPLLAEHERGRVLTHWSVGPATTPRATGLVHQLFEAQAARTPQAFAIEGPDETRTYDQVERQSNRLAHALRARGASPEDKVAILLERSPDAVVAMLGVMKSGAAYLPLDAEDPEERLRFVVEDSGARWILTRRTNEAIAGDLQGVEVLCLDDLENEPALAGQPEDRPVPVAMPHNLAYVIYTSGSTGRPKGVGIEHRQLVNYTVAAIDRLGIEPGWRFGLISTLGADLGNTAIYPALATGGSRFS